MTTEALPDHIGPYQVVGLLGRGGMGSVYKAFKPPLRRYVAVKIIKAEFTATPGALERFRREAELASELKHPNIVTVFDYEEVPGGDSYIVTELIEGGETLRDRLSKGPLPLDEAADILSQTASALDYAFDKAHIVHRDVKPSNIFLESGKRVALGDFGIAKDVSSDTALTAVNQGIGTPDYMSPEQAMGEGLDRRSDIYSLGIVLYEMLAGRVPFRGDTPISVVLSHIQKPVPALRQFKSDLPSEVQPVIDRALSKRKEDRYPTATALSDAFKGAIKPGPSQAATEVVSTGAVAALAGQLAQIDGLEGTGRYQVAFDRLQELHNQYPQDTTVNGRYQNYVSRGYTYSGSNTGPNVPTMQPAPSPYNPNQPTNQYQPTNQHPPAATGPTGGYTPYPAQGSYPPASQYPTGGGSGQYTPYPAQPSGQYGATPPTKKSSLPLILGGIAALVVLAGIIAVVVAGGGKQPDKNATATAGAIAAVPTASPVPLTTTLALTTVAPTTKAATTAAPTTAAVTTVAPTTVPATTSAADAKAQAVQLAKQGDDLFNAKQYKEAAVKYKQASQLDPTVATYFEYLTRSYFQLDQYADMEEPARKAIELSPNNAAYQYYLGYSFYWRNRYPDAEKYFKSAVQIASGEALYQQYLARAIIAQSRYAEAEPIAKKAVDLNAGLPDSHNTLGRAYLGQDKYPEAEKEFRAAVSQSSSSATFEYNLALTLNDEDKYPEGEAEARKAIKLDDTYANAWQALSLSLRYQERYDEALEAGKKAVTLDSKDAFNHLQVALALNGLKRYPEAEVAANKAIQLDGTIASAHNALGDALYNQSKYKESIPPYQNAVKSNSKSYLYLTNLADAYAKTSDYPKARDAYNRALALKPDYKDALDGLAAIKDK